MVKVREARRAFRRFRVRCFWSYRPDLEIGLEDVPWVAESDEAWRPRGVERGRTTPPRSSSGTLVVPACRASEV